MFSFRTRPYRPLPAPLALVFLLMAVIRGGAQTPNAAPSFTPGGNVTVFEDAGAQRVSWASNLSTGPAGEAAQTLHFVVTVDKPALFAAPPALDDSGILAFTPSPNAHGTATLSVVLRDDGGVNNGGVDASFPHTFTITVASVNDAPAFSAGSDVTVPENANTQALEGWATNLKAGPANESTQALAFLVTASPTTLFKDLPTVDPQGNLTFTPAPDAYGTATVSVVLRDNGGTHNAGTDRSLPQTFTLKITPVNDAPFLRTPPAVFLTRNSLAHTLPLTGITPGFGETGQGLTLRAITDNPHLLDITGIEYAPGNATASLLFQPRPGQTGTATVTVLLTDNGGTAGGGLDSYTTAFRVEVADVSLLLLPALFSPTGDAPDGGFHVPGEGVTKVRLLTFTPTELGVFGMDESMQGQPLTPDVSFRRKRGYFADGRSVRVQGKYYGQVNLVR